MRVIRRTLLHPDGTIREVYDLRAPDQSQALRPMPSAAPGAPGRGLGDLVEKLARPIAKASDRLLGTKLSGCSACSKRRRKLNQWIPDLKHPLRRP